MVTSHVYAVSQRVDDSGDSLISAQIWNFYLYQQSNFKNESQLAWGNRKV